MFVVRNPPVRNGLGDQNATPSSETGAPFEQGKWAAASMRRVETLNGVAGLFRG
jgi:hypothetical protein